MHPSIARAHELLEQVNATLDRCAAIDAERPFDKPDALEAWRASMPHKPKAPVDMRQYVDTQMMTLARAVGAEAGETEKSLRAEIKTLRTEVEALRADIKALKQPTMKLIGRAHAA